MNIMFKSNDLHNFTFRKVGSGCYSVTYVTDNRGDMYACNIKDMSIIDDTLNADIAKVNDIKHLAYILRRDGSHYNKYMKLIPRKV